MAQDNPTDPFKRAVAGAMRSIAGEPELEVVFSPEQPSLKGKKARLPLPSRTLPAEEVAAIRGAADAYALRLAHHRDKIDKDLRPAGVDAAALYDAAEQARVEAIGALAMKGMKTNLSANAALRSKQRGLGDVSERGEVVHSEVLGLIVREKLTGEAPPKIARTAVDAWRSYLEQKAGPDLDRLAGAIRDQRAYARITRKILNDLQLADDISEEESSEEGEASEEDQPEGADSQDGSDSEASENPDVEVAQDESDAADKPSVEMPTELPDPDNGRELKEGMRPWRPDLPFSDVERWDYIPRYSTK
jgi:cobaltochelatase CobT